MAWIFIEETVEIQNTHVRNLSVFSRFPGLNSLCIIIIYTYIFIYTYDWITVLYAWNQHDIVNQLCTSIKKMNSQKKKSFLKEISGSICKVESNKAKIERSAETSWRGVWQERGSDRVLNSLDILVSC